MLPTALIRKSFDVFHHLDLRQQAGIFMILSLAVFAPFIPGSGWDFLEAYRQETLTGAYGGVTWNPYPAYWLFYPFAILPPTLGFLAWNVFTAVCFIVAIYRAQARFLPFALSLPAVWIFFSGQIEGALALGLTLSLTGNPLLVGLGLTLLSLKPQVGALAILFILLHRRNWRDLLVPTAVYLLSFVYWGWWIPEWVAALLASNRSAYASLSLFPYSLILLPLLWLGRSSIKVWLLVESVTMPYFAVYSLAPVMCLGLPGWSYFLLWVVYLPAPFVEYRIPDFIVPLALLGLFAWQQWQARHTAPVT
ncbi:MAG: hypothetical protein KC441_06455 [Anaerolineales bacterium]|nr:hypothetical protein [Anaerolineales bacterium]